MAKILLIISLFLISNPLFAHDRETEKAIKDISLHLALINQELAKIHVLQEENLCNNLKENCSSTTSKVKHMRQSQCQQSDSTFFKTRQAVFESVINEMVTLKKATIITATFLLKDLTLILEYLLL